MNIACDRQLIDILAGDGLAVALPSATTTLPGWIFLMTSTGSSGDAIEGSCQRVYSVYGMAARAMNLLRYRGMPMNKAFTCACVLVMKPTGS